MFDSIRLGIPLTRTQHRSAIAACNATKNRQWVLYDTVTGEMLFKRVSGLASMDGESFHREIRFDLPPEYSDRCLLTVELSLPKLWQGHNIHLLYDFTKALDVLKERFEQQLNLKGKTKLVDPEQWEVSRVDICYNWEFPSQRMAHEYLDSLKRIHYPQKKPTIYEDGILFKGNTYSLKFYLKLPEFKLHDQPALLKGKCSLEWLNQLEAWAQGVLRAEVLLRRRYLKRNQISTVADLLEPVGFIEWLTPRPESERMREALFELIQQHLLHESKGELVVLQDGDLLSLPPCQIEYKEAYIEPDTNRVTHEVKSLEFPETKVVHRLVDRSLWLMQYFLHKFLGDETAMQDLEKIDELLTKLYKPAKAARLLSFWLFVQRLGTAKAREKFGNNSYYYNRKELKKAGVSLVEPPDLKVVSLSDRRFLENFRLEVPSEYVTNKHDNFRDHANVLNFVPKWSQLG